MRAPKNAEFFSLVGIGPVAPSELSSLNMWKPAVPPISTFALATDEHRDAIHRVRFPVGGGASASEFLRILRLRRGKVAQ